jgi:adenosine deaminase/aminodeoxyfutalosine deaminase
VVQFLRTPDDYALVTRRLLERLAQDNVRYAEITLAAGVVLLRKQEFGPIFDAVRREAARSAVEVNWILDAVRHFGVEAAWPVARLAAERAGASVVAFGIGGNEAEGPTGQFAEVFRFARQRGLHVTAHAGEVVGPESVRAALDAGAERIGHGFRAAEDPALVAELRQRDVPLEICLTSNVATRAAPSLAEHPVRRLFDAGVPIILNTDDPAMFETTLSAEYRLAARQFGFTEDELRQVAQIGFRYAFR